MWKSGEDKKQLIKCERHVTIDLNVVELSKKPVKYYEFEWGVWQLLTLTSFVDMTMTVCKQDKTPFGLVIQTIQPILVVLCFLHVNLSLYPFITYHYYVYVSS